MKLRLSLFIQVENRNMKNKMKIKYDPDADVLSASRGEIKDIDHAEEMGDVILHVNRKDEPVLVEVLNASKIFLRPILGALKSDASPRRNRRTGSTLRKLVAA